LYIENKLLVTAKEYNAKIEIAAKELLDI